MDHGHGWAVCLCGHAAKIEIRLFEVVGPLLPAAARRADVRCGIVSTSRQRPRRATCDEPSQTIENLARLSRES